MLYFFDNSTEGLSHEYEQLYASLFQQCGAIYASGYSFWQNETKV